MKRPADAFVLASELGQRLCILRPKAGLARMELAKFFPPGPRPKR